jgi:hypothetical protein
MKRFLVVIAALVLSAWVYAEEFPTQEERKAINDQLQARRNAIDAEYKQTLIECYQKFDVNGCRVDARERRIASDKALRPDELAYRAMERRIHADEVRRSLEDKNSEARKKEAEAQRAQALEDRKQRVSDAERKQIEHELIGSKRGEYAERQKHAKEHREDVEKRLRERTESSAASLPVPGASR